MQPTPLIGVDARLIHDFINILVRANVIDLGVKLLIAHWNCRTFKLSCLLENISHKICILLFIMQCVH